MTRFEIASMVGYYRSGATWQEIGWIMGISESRAKSLVEEYLETEKK